MILDQENAWTEYKLTDGALYVCPAESNTHTVGTRGKVSPLLMCHVSSLMMPLKRRTIRSL